MKYFDLVVRSSDNLRVAKLRTSLTMLAIGIGAFAMTMGLALNTGGAGYLDKIISSNIDSQSLYVLKKRDERSSSLYPSRYDGTPGLQFHYIYVKPLQQSDLDTVQAIKGVKAVEPEFVIDNAVISRPGSDEYDALVNVAHDNTYRVYIAGDSTHLNSDDIVLADGYRQALGFVTPDDAIGKRVTLTVPNGANPSKKKSFTYTVRAITKPSSLSIYAAPMTTLISVDAAKAMSDFTTKGTALDNKFIAASAKVDPNEDINAVKQRIIDSGYTALSAKDAAQATYQIVGAFRFVLIIFGTIAVLTAIFGIINTQYISVLERVQEIGMMKALGMGGKDVRKLFEMEAAVIGLVGSGIGTLLAVGLGTFMNPFVTGALELDIGTQLMDFTAVGTLGVVVLLTVTAMIAGLLPAKKAANLDPVEALRNDNL